MASASVIIVTRNRRELVKRTVASSLAQVGSPEIVLMDDASNDDTATTIRHEFPSVRVYRSCESTGYIVQRNRAVEKCTAPVVFSIDDDAEFIDPETISATLKLFENPMIGAVSIPFVNRGKDGGESRMVPPVPDDQHMWLAHTFIGTANAFRRDIFLKLGGFQELLYHWAEEGEYCQRLMNAGYFVAVGSRGMIVHYPEGVGKYSPTVNRYIYRNSLLTIWFNAPLVLLPPLMIAQIARGFVAGVRRPRDSVMILQGFAMAFKTMFTKRGLRKPLKLSCYRLWMRLRRERPVPLADIPEALATPTA